MSALWTSIGQSDFDLVAGKVQNLRVAAKCLDGLVVPAGKTLSFWKVVGRPTRRRAFALGRELREGCLVASLGGGLCQLSNAIYSAALEAGLEIVERHAHSRIVPGSMAEIGRDATVFWNYVDLRIRHTQDFVLDVRLSTDELVVQIRVKSAGKVTVDRFANTRCLTKVYHLAETGNVQDCVTCEQSACVNHIPSSTRRQRSAYLLDEVWPEYDQWAQSRVKLGDVALVPVNGARRGRSNYHWTLLNVPGIAPVEHPWQTLRRSLVSRLVAQQGAVRQRHLLSCNAALARAYAGRIALDTNHLVVPVTLLADLAALGVLGGREYEVLMNRAPLAMLHASLDHAARLHPQSQTLADFRASPELVRMETEAIRMAKLVITSHSYVFEYVNNIIGAKTQLIPWRLPTTTPTHVKPVVPKMLFPASGLARKGAYEVRTACHRLNLAVSVLGTAQELPGFWDNCQVTPADPKHLFEGISAVVLPAFVENRPGILLSAIAHGVPVICTPECGIAAGWPDLTVVDAGSTDQLAAALQLYC